MKKKKLAKLLEDIIDKQTTAIIHFSSSAEVTVKIIMDHIESIANHQADIMKEIKRIKGASKPVQPPMDRPTKKLA